MNSDELPLPDLPDPVDGAPGSLDEVAKDEAPSLALDEPSGERFDVVLLRFTADDAEHALQTLLGVDAMTADNLLCSVPVVLRASVFSGQALHLEAALRGRGADVELRPSGGVDPHDAARKAIAQQNSFAPGALKAPASTKTSDALPPQTVAALGDVKMPRKLQRAVGAEPALDVDFEAGFWPRFLPSLLVPLRGWGVAWILGLTAVLFFTLFSRITCLGFLAMPFFASLYLGGLATFFGQCAQAGLEDDVPGFELPSRDEIALRGVVVAIAGAILALLPWGAAHHGAPLPLVLFLGLLPYLYWPMAIAAVGLTGRLLAVFDVVVVGRGIWAGGLPYLAIVAFGWLWIAGAGLLLGLSLTLGALPALLATAFFALSFSYVAGAQGALVGRLVASRPEPFRAFLPGSGGLE